MWHDINFKARKCRGGGGQGFHKTFTEEFFCTLKLNFTEVKEILSSGRKDIEYVQGVRLVTCMSASEAKGKAVYAMDVYKDGLRLGWPGLRVPIMFRPDKLDGRINLLHQH